jgi:hypothetical protein
MTSTLLNHKILIGDLNGATGAAYKLGEEKRNEGVQPETSPEFVYALRLAISRNDAEICKMLVSLAPDDHTIDPDTLAAAALKSLTVFTTVFGTSATNEQRIGRPLLMATSVGNTVVAKFLIHLLRHYKSSNITLKEKTLEVAVASESVSIIKLLVRDQHHAEMVFSMFVSAGKIDSAIRMSDSEYLDFNKADYKLIRLCYPYPTLLAKAIGHKSLDGHRDNLSTKYLQVAVDMAKTDHKHTVDTLKVSYKDQLKAHATRKALATGCSAKTAITEAHAELCKYYSAPKPQ